MDEKKQFKIQAMKVKFVQTSGTEVTFWRKANKENKKPPIYKYRKGLQLKFFKKAQLVSYFKQHKST